MISFSLSAFSFYFFFHFFVFLFSYSFSFFLSQETFVFICFLRNDPISSLLLVHTVGFCESGMFRSNTCILLSDCLPLVQEHDLYIDSWMNLFLSMSIPILNIHLLSLSCFLYLVSWIYVQTIIGLR